MTPATRSFREEIPAEKAAKMGMVEPDGIEPPTSCMPFRENRIRVHSCTPVFLQK